MALTAKQKLFVNHYLVLNNATEAARKAGYKEPNKQGPRLLVNVGIKEALEKAQEKTQEKFDLTQEWVVNGLKEEAEYKGEGASHSARVRARELLGKQIGMFADRLKVGGDPASPPVQIDWGTFVAATIRPDPVEEVIQGIQDRPHLNGTAHHD